MTQANPTALLRQTHIDTIHTLFADPPSLRAVAQASAQAHLDEHFAARTLTAEQLYLRTPLAGQTATYDYTALADALVARLVNGEPVLYVPGHHESVQRVGMTMNRAHWTSSSVKCWSMSAARCCWRLTGSSCRSGGKRVGGRWSRR